MREEQSSCSMFTSKIICSFTFGAIAPTSLHQASSSVFPLNLDNTANQAFLHTKLFLKFYLRSALNSEFVMHQCALIIFKSTPPQILIFSLSPRPLCRIMWHNNLYVCERIYVPKRSCFSNHLSGIYQNPRLVHCLVEYSGTSRKPGWSLTWKLIYNAK